MKTGKRYAEAMKNVDRAALYDVADAISIVKKNASAKFDETVELHSRSVELLFFLTEQVRLFVS